MGSMVLFRILEAGSDGACGTEATFSNIVFGAPDIGKDAFEERFQYFSEKADRVTLYASSHDVALMASKRMEWGNEVRLGQGGMDHLAIIEGMDSLDASNVEKSPRNIIDWMPQEFPGHAYLFSNR